LAGIERLAAELRQANPKLSAAAAMSKALISERGSQYYRLYSKAQRIREEAAQ
jgi:regulator of protease activity HflC (stomatin/prohibitin superfamily)